MKKDTYVYCTECKDGTELIDTIKADKDLPSNCKTCFPYNPEDSFMFQKRPNYFSKE